jgi:hypothetical protein
MILPIVFDLICFSIALFVAVALVQIGSNIKKFFNH